jgi:hypothetical protein
MNVGEIGHITRDPFTLVPSNEPPLALNESLLCAYCGDTWRVLFLGPLGTMRVVKSHDQEREAHAEMSHCPSCQRRDIGVRLTRPVPTRQQMRDALKEALDEWLARATGTPCMDSDFSRERIAAIRKEFNL